MFFFVSYRNYFPADGQNGFRSMQEQQKEQRA